MSEAHRRRLQDPDARAVMMANLQKGRDLMNSPEGRVVTAERMRIQMTNRVVSDETRSKLRQAATGQIQSYETKAKRSESLKLAHREGRHPGFPDDIFTRGSKLEDALAKLLDALGVNFERQYFAHIPGCGRHPWDFGIPSRKVLIEVDGCYWHGCNECGFPGIKGRREIDEKQTKLAEAFGWKVIRIPGHVIRHGNTVEFLTSRNGKAGIFDSVG